MIAYVLGRLVQFLLSLLVASVAVFAFYFPILSALPLSSGGDYLIWAWLKGWR